MAENEKQDGAKRDEKGRWLPGESANEATKWKVGQNGNPENKNKNGFRFRTHIRTLMREEVVPPNSKGSRQRAQEFLLVMVKQAMDGDSDMAKYLMDLHDGRLDKNAKYRQAAADRAALLTEEDMAIAERLAQKRLNDREGDSVHRNGC